MPFAGGEAFASFEAWPPNHFAPQRSNDIVQAEEAAEIAHVSPGPMLNFSVAADRSRS